MSWANRSLAFFARRGSSLLAVAIFGGALFPPLARAAHPLLSPIVFVLMVAIFLRVDLPGTFAHLRRPRRAAIMVAGQLLISPLLMAAIIAPLHLEPSIAAGLIIFAAGCAATSSPAFARMVGLDPDLSLVVALASTLLVPFTAPPLVALLAGIALPIGTGAFTARLLFFVALPALLSLGLRQAIGPDRLAVWGEAIDGALVLLLFFYGFGVMDGLGARALADPAWVAIALAAAFLADYALNAMTTLALWPLGARTAAAAGLMAGNRNMALFIAVLPASADNRITLFFGLCQFPLFLSPFLLRPVYRRLLPPPVPAGARPGDARSRR